MTGSERTPPDRPYVRIERSGRIAWLILDRPEVHNALCTAMNLALIDALTQLDDDASVGCIVLRGAGERAFSAGADLREVTGKQAEQYRAEFDTIADSLDAIRRTTTLVIAAVRGYALGGGLGLVAAADLVIAADDAVFGTPEITIGRFPFIISVVIERIIGPRKMAELAFTGERFNAHEARDMGLANRVVPAAGLWESAEALAARLASFSPAVLAMGKDALRTAAGMDVGQALAYMTDRLTMNAVMPDSETGVSAFLEKRPPVWR
ncbi:enoyl-CoA hydratase/isomerase family protein [Jiangella asiatica]|nr:enoyl-CoA hydratase-related protein [Jiangella asiatica]